MHSEIPTPGASAPAEDTAIDDAGLGAELEQLRTALGSLREEALRERAELENQRKRLARDVDQARRFADAPTIHSPSFVSATIDGVVRSPSEFSMTFATPPSITETQLLVVPRSMPMILPMVVSSKRFIYVVALAGRAAARSKMGPAPLRSRPRRLHPAATATRAGRSSRSLST